MSILMSEYEEKKLKTKYYSVKFDNHIPFSQFQWNTFFMICHRDLCDHDDCSTVKSWYVK